MHPCILLYVPIKWDQVTSYCTVQYCTDVCVRTVLASLELGSPLIDVCDVCMFVRHR
jgi:hypothetical protein